MPRQADVPSFAGSVVSFPLAAAVSRGADLEKINQFDFYEMGKTFEGLRYTGDVERRDVIFEHMMATRRIKDLLNGKPIPLGVSRKQAESLLSSLAAIENEFFSQPDGAGGQSFRFPADGDLPIPEWRWSGLVKTLDRFETVFREELGETATYYVPRKGIYSTAALVESADESFPSEVSGFIPEKTKQDWRAAGRCLALNLLTASGFHVARAVEGTMEAYYQLFSSNAGATLKSWHDYILEIEKISKTNPTPCPSAKTLAELKQMKDDYRNPIAHPRVVLSEADARMLFNNGESVIICMAQELADAHAHGQQKSLALVVPATGGAE